MRELEKEGELTSNLKNDNIALMYHYFEVRSNEAIKLVKLKINQNYFRIKKKIEFLISKGKLLLKNSIKYKQTIKHKMLI